MDFSIPSTTIVTVSVFVLATVFLRGIRKRSSIMITEQSNEVQQLEEEEKTQKLERTRQEQYELKIDRRIMSSPTPSTHSSSTSVNADRDRIKIALKVSSALFQDKIINSVQRSKLKSIILDHDERVLSAVENYENTGDVVKLVTYLKSLVD